MSFVAMCLLLFLSYPFSLKVDAVSFAFLLNSYNFLFILECSLDLMIVMRTSRCFSCNKGKRGERLFSASFSVEVLKNSMI